jgi:UDPglucose--hexose-1-phosphate uridylyltransferase
MGEWVLVSPQRTQRPWLGQVEEVPQEELTEYDPDCYLCPGNSRSGEKQNPNYGSTFVFENDFPALLPALQTTPVEENLQAGEKLPGLDPQQDQQQGWDFLQAQPEAGICRVVCFSPRHNASMPDLSVNQIKRVVQTWIDQTVQLGGEQFLKYVQIFENKGAQMGASNPHPHCQIWATEHLPNVPAKELLLQKAYLSENGSCMLCDYLRVEKQHAERIVVENDHFSALVPFWAVWPFEVLLLADRHVSGLLDLMPSEIESLADILLRLTTRYDNLFEIKFPYSMGFHQAPMDDLVHPEWHLHAHFYPPLLRSATVRKFMVGFEMLATPQRDLTPETAAERLRSQSETLYRQAR